MQDENISSSSSATATAAAPAPAASPATAADAKAPPMSDATPTSDSSSSSVAAAELTLAQQIAANEFSVMASNQQYIQAIEDEVRLTQPLCGTKEDIIELVLSYNEDTSPQYFAKAQELSGTYSHIRRIRGDGNCFYRAMLTAQLERIFNDKGELDKFAALCKGWRDKLYGFGFPELTTGDFCDAMDVLLESIKNGTKTFVFLFDDLNQDSIANYYVAFMRLICSGYIRENGDLYAGFIEGEQSLDQFCKNEVEPMWRDADHICITALVNAIQVPIRIEYMDRTQAPNGGWHHDFLMEDGRPPQLHFLYRPGHYDILYKPMETETDPLLPSTAASSSAASSSVATNS